MDVNVYNIYRQMFFSVNFLLNSGFALNDNNKNNNNNNLPHGLSVTEVQNNTTTSPPLFVDR